MMDPEHLVDNVASIKIYLRIGDKEGYIWLSAIYGSYNLESSIEIEPGQVAQFKCPHCFQELKSEEHCSECNAPLVDFHLVEGGKVSLCSRAGCKKHSIEFEDLSTALNHFYNEFELQKCVSTEAVQQTVKKKKAEKPDAKEVLGSGSFLNSYCPHCKMSLINDNLLILKVEKLDGEMGILYMSPYLNVFTHTTTVKIPEKAPVKDIKCIYCDHSLVHEEKKCPKCNSDLVRINVSAMRKLIDFYFCSRKGCVWHGLSDEDLNYITLEDSQEW
jgi:ssDNA-binding Zn-finger/Zn-ribbon topoisomerase 1